jgi:DNA excision repair protein ERCC-2
MRSDPGVVRNYGRLLLEMASAVPGGIVCFFVSYSYMDDIVRSWNDMGILQVISLGYFPHQYIILLWRCLEF